MGVKNGVRCIRKKAPLSVQPLDEKLLKVHGAKASLILEPITRRIRFVPDRRA